MALGIINNIPANDFIIYLEGCRSHSGRAGRDGSGIYSNTSDGDGWLQHQKPRLCLDQKLSQSAKHLITLFVWPGTYLDPDE